MRNNYNLSSQRFMMIQADDLIHAYVVDLAVFRPMLAIDTVEQDVFGDPLFTATISTFCHYSSYSV